MNRRLISISKFLSLVLGLKLDAEGWVEIDRLLEAANAQNRNMDHNLLLRVVHENDKQRFVISQDGARIRANQGHSIDVVLGLAAKLPLETLYHGTVERYLSSIREQGLISGHRQHVHLSSDKKTAEKVGQRRGTPIVLVVEAIRMHNRGFAFYLSQNGVWLTAQVPPEFLQFP